MANKKKGTGAVRELVGVRFSADERQLVQRAADKIGVALGTYVRIATLSAARGEPPPSR